MNHKIADVLRALDGSASDMTHALKALGDDDMGKGIQRLLLYGGELSAVGVIGAVGSVYALIQLVRWLKVRKCVDVQEEADDVSPVSDGESGDAPCPV